MFTSPPAALAPTLLIISLISPSLRVLAEPTWQVADPRLRGLPFWVTARVLVTLVVTVWGTLSILMFVPFTLAPFANSSESANAGRPEIKSQTAASI